LKRRAVSLVVVSGALGLATACSAVLGFEPLTLYPSEAGAAEAGQTDAPVPSGPSDAAPGSDAGDAATCAADLTSDPKNCGRCNHDCLGGKCESSQCTPIKLADGLAYPEGLVVSSTSVYVAELDQNRILRFGNTSLGVCVKQPPPKECILTEDPTNVFQPTAMGIDATHVYWANAGFGFAHQVRSCPLEGCGAVAAATVAQLGEDAFGQVFGNDPLPLELVVRDGQVYWPENNGAAIRSAPATGGGPISTYLESSSFSPLAIAVDDTRIFFTDDSHSHPTQIQAVSKTQLDAGTAQVVASTNAPPYAIALSAAGNLYWTIPSIAGTGDGLVQSIVKTSDGGTPVGALASAQIDPHAILVDDRNVYWLLVGDSATATGMVVYCRLTGCPSEGPIILASEQRYPRHLAQDASAIYWSNEGLSSSSDYDGQVWKIAKP
jgi:hypothetical protein